MHKLLVAGIDSVVGANVAAELANRFDIVGISFSHPISILGCRTAVCPSYDADAIRGWVAGEQPDWLIYCGPASHSSWSLEDCDPPGEEAISAIDSWARAAEASDCELTVISSDGVFRGPWMFHDEETEHYCDSSAARTIREIEQHASDICANTLIVRTNAYGWSPSQETPGLIETILGALERGDHCKLDCIRHATPILANDLAEILERAFHERLRGVYHIPGAERTNPFAFARRLADRFGYSEVHVAADDWRTRGGRVFGDGETSLRSTQVREALGLAPPMLMDGLDRLFSQWDGDYRDRFGAAQPLLADKVA